MNRRALLASMTAVAIGLGVGTYLTFRHSPTPEPLESITLGESMSEVPDVQIEVLPDRSGSLISYEGGVQVWRFGDEPKTILDPDGLTNAHEAVVAFTNEWLLLIDDENRLRRLDYETGALADFELGGPDGIWSGYALPDGTMIGTADSGLVAWDPRSDATPRQITYQDAPDGIIIHRALGDYQGGGIITSTSIGRFETLDDLYYTRWTIDTEDGVARFEGSIPLAEMGEILVGPTGRVWGRKFDEGTALWISGNDHAAEPPIPNEPYALLELPDNILTIGQRDDLQFFTEYFDAEDYRPLHSQDDVTFHSLAMIDDETILVVARYGELYQPDWRVERWRIEDLTQR